MEYFTTSAGLPLHISESNSGQRTVLFLHGYLETLYVWEDFGAMFSGSSRILSLDLPGFGLSGSAPEINTVDHVSDVIFSLLEKLSVPSADIVAHSMGGYYALSFLKSHPEKVRSLALLSSSPYPDTEQTVKRRNDEIGLILNGKLMTIAHLSLPNMFARKNLRRMDSLLQEILEICETHDPLGVAASLRGIAVRPDTSDTVRSFLSKILFIYGDQDRFYPPEAIGRVRDDFGASRTVVIADAGHGVFLEQPAAVYKTIADFQLTIGNC